MRALSASTVVRATRVVLGLLAMGCFAAPAADAYHGDFDSDSFSDGFEVYGGSSGTSPASTPESLTLDALGITFASCIDAADNDGDGLTDLLDPGCLNSDGDTLFGFPLDDTVETNLGSLPGAAFSTPEHWFIDVTFFPVTCSNGLDDDADGPFDLGDVGCYIDADLDGVPAGFGDTEGFLVPNTFGLFGTDDCSDGEDNNGNGLTDGADPACVDSDGDGTADPYDSEGPQGDGSSNGLGGGDDCYDGVDNNGNSLIDALEPDCGLCLGLAPTISGTPGDDVLTGTPGPDVIMGFQGNDRIRGMDGDDLICAGPGDDRVNAGAGFDDVSGSDGNDVVAGSTDDDNVVGDAGDDILRGNSGSDFLAGGTGDDRLLGGGDNDACYGDNGNDVIRGGGGNDSALVGHAGDDDIRGGGGNDVLFGLVGNDVLRGNGGDDSLFGGDDGDDMAGGGGVDYCDGEGSLVDVVTGTSCETVANVP